MLLNVHSNILGHEDLMLQRIGMGIHLIKIGISEKLGNSAGLEGRGQDTKVDVMESWQQFTQFLPETEKMPSTVPGSFRTHDTWPGWTLWLFPRASQQPRGQAKYIQVLNYLYMLIDLQKKVFIIYLRNLKICIFIYLICENAVTSH